MTAFHQTAQWKATVKTWRPRFASQIANGGVRCLNCPRTIRDDEVWEIGHRISVAEAIEHGMTVTELCDPELIWPAHRKCNRRDGQRIGIARRKVAVNTARGHFNW